ncbi:MAG: hypothetical protein V3U06_11915, partial [Candidatus Binatia bacterium]
MKYPKCTAGLLARISHQPTAAGAHLPESTALGSDKGLDLLSSTPARFALCAPCISGHLRSLTSRSGEKCGLGENLMSKIESSTEASMEREPSEA